MKTLTWDVDDVLNDQMRDWLQRWWLPQHPQCKVAYEEIKENPPQRVLSIPLQTYLDSLDAFRQELGASLRPNAAVLAWFQQHGPRFRHMALTTTPLHFADISAAWVMKHFGNWIRSFNVVPSPRATISHVHYDGTKAEFLDWLGPSDMMIDDNPATIAEMGQHSISTLLWPQPWNGSSMAPAEALETLARLG
ncbi:MAG: hypothetical protein ACLQVY_06585 [Limisphaerales bacterium]